MGLYLGLVGLGSFGQAFADLYRSHPLVDRIALCDREPERMAAIAERPGWDKKFDPRDSYADLDAMLKSDVDAVVIITQPWLHAPQCVQAMQAGKHVYSAVPIIQIPDGDEILDWCDRIIETSSRTGQYYMLGETTYYHPETMFCRRKAAEGAFGDFVYAEGEYYHDLDSGSNLREVFRRRTDSASGREWLTARQRYMDAGILDGPMHYPTHSTSGPVAVMGAHALNVTCHGYANRSNDPYFEDAIFSNEVALYRMSNGAIARICEFREVGGPPHHPETFRILGSAATFAEDTWMENGRATADTGHPAERISLTDEEMRDPLPDDVAVAFARIGNPDATQPSDFTPTGHRGSHPYLVHEFVSAVSEGRQPAINAWEAARYMVMGVMAHKSALKDGETLAVPDWGDAPGS